MIKRADASRLAQDALVLDFSDMVRHGEALRRRAEEDASATVAQARAERERLVSTAAETGRREGYAKGHAEGRAAGLAEGRAAGLEVTRAEAERLIAAWGQALAGFSAAREALIAEARRDVVTLAALVAERVTKRVVEVDDAIIGPQLEAALRLVSRRTSARVLVSPEDAASAREMLPGLVAALGTVEHAEVTADASLSRGSCLVRTSGGGEIEATVEGQLARVIEAAFAGTRVTGSGSGLGEGPGEGAAA